MSHGDEPTLVDGSVLEGGGQILRVAVVCSVVLGQPLRVIKIRAGRSKPGLSNQHLAGIQLSAELCNGSLSKCDLGSTELVLCPAAIKSGDFEADAKTAGSISLLLQVALPILTFANADSVLRLRGGTDALFAPPIGYMDEIACHYFSKMGLDCKLEVIRRGFYPQGGGIVKAVIKHLAGPFSSIRLLDSGPVKCITGYAFVAGRVPVKVAHEMKQEAVNCCKTSFSHCPVEIEVFREDDQRCVGNIATFMFVAHTENDCKLAVSGISAPRGPRHTKLVEDAIAHLASLVNVGACCDDYMQDQLILPMALAKGRSEIHSGPLTMHTKTAIHVVELMLHVKFQVTELENGASIIACDGIGHVPCS
ncbi:unnamed protein product [Calicophoron daubneyi]|uniref:RNA 3'-terminal phosphate cyclase n=1 Tax=Calicophoron daubneyi TaxID=300641 RepID=A0AAV2TKE3_CALDB